MNNERPVHIGRPLFSRVGRSPRIQHDGGRSQGGYKKSRPQAYFYKGKDI